MNRLARRPGQLAFGEEVDVKVGDGLGGVGPIVDDQAKAFFEVQFFCHSDGGEKQVSERRLIGGRSVGNARDGFFWDNEEMNRRLRLDVVKHDAVFILVFDFRGDLAIDDALKNGFGHELFLQEETEATESSE